MEGEHADRVPLRGETSNPALRASAISRPSESIPLPDASVDAVVISAAWHWLDPERAVPEITRGLRLGGTLGVICISRDDRVP